MRSSHRANLTSPQPETLQSQHNPVARLQWWQRWITGQRGCTDCCFLQLHSHVESNTKFLTLGLLFLPGANSSLPFLALKPLCFSIEN